jgi:membrane-associated phospholipid phosphatase
MARSGKRKGIGRQVARMDRAARTGAAEDSEALAFRAMEWIGDLGDQPQLRSISAALLVVGAVRSDRRLVRAAVRMLLAHELATLLKNVVKTSVDRTRPRSMDGRGHAPLRPGKTQDKEESSFPSGHAAGAVAVARALGRELPEQRLPALVGAGVIAGVQVPRDAHHLSDVVAGALIGMTAEAAANAWWNLATRIERRYRPA